MSRDTSPVSRGSAELDGRGSGRKEPGLRRAVRSRPWFGNPGDSRKLWPPNGGCCYFGVVDGDPCTRGWGPIEIDRELVIIVRLDLGTFVLMRVLRQAKMCVSKPCCVVMIRIVGMYVRERSLHVGTRKHSR